jgi:periplasmic protein TonB
MAGRSKNNGIRLRSRLRTQPSLFHYIKETPDPSVFEDIDWNFLKHPIRTFKESRSAPRTRPSLFHYIDEERQTPYTWKAFFIDTFTGFRNPLFIPSVFSDPEEWALERAQGRTRKMEALMLVVFMYVALIFVTILIIRHPEDLTLQKENIVFVNNPVYLPFEGDGLDGGGGGGGGKNEQAPPATGVMPETTRVQMIAPDPTNPQPLLPAEDLLALAPSVQMPIDIPQDPSLPIGDISAPPNYSMSSGPGSGGGIGTGQGTGVGSGSGAGVGPGSGGGMGGGSGGGIGSGIGPHVVGNGVTAPVPLVEVKPAYTEEARKARAEGLVVLQCVIDRNGTADSFKVLRGLGYGLDESAISTIANKWRFKPGTLNGKPVDVKINIEVSFRLF